MNIGDIPRKNSLRFPNKQALVFNGQGRTWCEVNDRVNSLAQAMLSKNLGRGDRVGILMENGLQNWEIYWACAKIGVINVPLNYKLRAEELRILLENARPKLIFAASDYIPLLHEVKEQCGLPQEIIQIEDSTISVEGINYEKLIKQFPANEPQVEVAETDPFAIFYTSGTTGLPKGALVSHRNLISNSFNQMYADQSSLQDKNYIVTPLYHMGAVFMSVTYTLMGCTQVIQKHFNVEEFLTTIIKEKISVCLLIPTMLNMVLNFPKFSDYDLSSLRLIFYGGGPMPGTILEKAIHQIGCGFTQGYGLTETLEATFLVSNDHILKGSEVQQKRLLSAGREAIGAEIRIVDELGHDLPSGKAGEILIKSDSVISGYWRMPELNEEVIKDGWFFTGDVGYLDEDRYLFVVDRIKDLIISGGVNIYPKEIESLLYTHPAVLEVAVIGIPDELWGESVKAVVVLRNEQKVGVDELINFCKDRLASYKKPKVIEIVSELPKNPSGKILKILLRKLH